MRLEVSRFVRRATSVIAVLGLATAMYGADDTTATGDAKQGDRQIQDLKQQLADQQKQLEELRLLLLNQKKQLDAVESKQAATPAVETPAKTNVGDVATVAPIVPPLPAAPAPKPAVPPTPAPAQKEAAAGGADTTSPLQFKIGDTTITPVGFMDLTNTWRSTNAGSSLQTNFGSIPYNNGVTGRLTEDKLSAANSRIGFRADGNYKGWDFLGYFEGDFVGGIGEHRLQHSGNPATASGGGGGGNG